MGERRLKTAVLGLKDDGGLLLETARGLSAFDICAVADKDTELCDETARRCGCKGFDDYRQLIIQNEFDCLLVAAGMYSCDQYVRAGMEKKFNMFKSLPVARNSEEANEFVRLAEKEGVQFAVAAGYRFAESFAAFGEKLAKIERPILVAISGSYSVEHRPSWHSDPELAGGGVLLRDCLDLVDQVVLKFGLPEQVYCVNTNAAMDRQQRQALTEDTAAVTMRFGEGLCGNVTATRHMGEAAKDEAVKVYGKDVILEASCGRVRLTDRDGEVIEEKKYADDRGQRLVAALVDFAATIVEPEEHKCQCLAKDALGAMAVVDAAYLSGRTQMPEEPGKL